MAEDDALRRWWAGLSDDERARVRELREGDDMPRELLVSLTHAGLPQAAAWWPSSQTGPRFTVPGRVVEYVAAQEG